MTIPGHKPNPVLFLNTGSLGVSAINTMAGKIVRDVISNMNVLNVTVSIDLRIVLFVPLFEPITLTKEPNPCPPLPSQVLPTPVKIDKLFPLLSGYTHSTVQYLLHGFTEGFYLGFDGPRISFHSDNLLSAFEHPDVVDVKLEKELSGHRIAGPFQSPPFSALRVSPLGVVPKKQAGDYRLIHHLSFPNGNSVNNYISPESSSVNYATIQDAIAFVKLVGHQCFLAKTDIRSAFRIIPINLSDYFLLGFMWKDSYYHDKCLPMGCSSSCKIFETFSTAVEWVARNKFKIPHILHLLDDFLIVAPTAALCQAQLSIFLKL